MYPDFYVSMALCLEYGYEQHGKEDLRDYLTQFTLAFHKPLLEKVKENGIVAVEEYLCWLYVEEEAADALERLLLGN